MPLRRSLEPELERRGKAPLPAPEQRAKMEKPAEVQLREKRAVDEAENVPEARKSQRKEHKKKPLSTKATAEEKKDPGLEDEEHESKKEVGEHVEEQTAKVNVAEQAPTDEELERLLQIVKGPPVFEGMYYYMPEFDRDVSFVEYPTNIRDCYLDLRCKPLLDDKILAFAREPPPRGQAGRYIVKYGKLEAVVAVNGTPRRNMNQLDGPAGSSAWDGR